jgi:hypothetical protein
MMNTITMTDEQLRVTMKALECYDRMNGGQMAIAIELVEQNPDSHIDKHLNRDLIDDVEKAYRKCFRADSPMRKLNASTWHGNNEALLARDIYNVIRQELAFRRMPEGGNQVMFDPVMRHAKDPLPVIMPSVVDPDKKELGGIPMDTTEDPWDKVKLADVTFDKNYTTPKRVAARLLAGGFRLFTYKTEDALKSFHFYFPMQGFGYFGIYGTVPYISAVNKPHSINGTGYQIAELNVNDLSTVIALAHSACTAQAELPVEMMDANARKAKDPTIITR